MADSSNGKQAVDEFARQQQVGMMHAAQVQFLTAITCTPPPSDMPVEVRKHMWHALEKTQTLFAARNPEEETFYAE